MYGRTNRTFGILIVVTAVLSVVMAWPAFAQQLTLGTWLSGDEWTKYEPQFAALAQALPDIGLDVVMVGSHGDYAGNVLLLAATGTLPDILQIPPEQVAPLVAAGLLEDLQPFMDGDAGFDGSAWPPGIMEAVQFDDIIFGVPLYVVNYAYAYNRDMFEQRGVALPRPDEHLTWAQIRDNARKTTFDRDGDGVMDVWGYYQGFNYDRILPAIYQAGGDVFDDNRQLQLTTPPVREAVNWLYELLHVDQFHPPNTIEQTGLFRGEVAAARFGSFQTPSLLQSGLSIGMAAGGQHHQTGEVMYVTTFAMTRDAVDKEAAWELLKWMTSVEAQKYVVQRGQVPMRTDVSIRDLLADAEESVLQGFISSLTAGRSYPYHVFSDYITQTFNSGMWPVYKGEAAPEPALIQIETQVNAFLREQ